MMKNVLLARKRNKEQLKLGNTKLNRQDQEYMKFKMEVQKATEDE